ncbi:MAG: DUF1573 domain-containing protein [Muribaculaceae bacterium]|nr:DUF1573 domain-containing protein [Muribaculaceae bacterium]
MRLTKLIYVLAGIIAVSCSYVKKPDLKLSDYEINLGDIAEDTQAYQEAKLYNKGNDKLVLRTVTTDCSCTKVKIDNMTILPNDSTTIHISFDSTGKDGPSENFVIIEANTDTIIHYIHVVSNVISKD